MFLKLPLEIKVYGIEWRQVFPKYKALLLLTLNFNLMLPFKNINEG